MWEFKDDYRWFESNHPIHTTQRIKEVAIAKSLKAQPCHCCIYRLKGRLCGTLFPYPKWSWRKTYSCELVSFHFNNLTWLYLLSSPKLTVHSLLKMEGWKMKFPLWGLDSQPAVPWEFSPKPRLRAAVIPCPISWGLGDSTKETANKSGWLIHTYQGVSTLILWRIFPKLACIFI